ncbi:hypothetical protein [uncultured Desulfosarcina sp.]|uniref:hypothetical protein n=1 Tax=uncultured Desulfosarcina sp. TaxID=218289 RepID=UPI0029C72642|nr:hypothetical protein [uncultured Desulfosarcina sp.]
MRKSLSMQHVILTAVFFLLFSMVIGCGSEASLETQISGSWKRAQGDGTVEINLDKKPTSLVFDGKTYTATIDKVDKGNNNVHLKVATDNGTSEEWTLHQVWNDNGSSFKLAFRHNGTEETLVPAKQS